MFEHVRIAGEAQATLFLFGFPYRRAVSRSTWWHPVCDNLDVSSPGAVPDWTRLPRRFWAKVDRSGDCWVWTASRDRAGYGKFGVNRSGWTRAHRVAHELAIGPIPAGLEVLHRCDNPPCVRPDHLIVGTRTDNMRDAKAKGRTAAGERNGAAKLSAEIAADIRARHAAGESQSALGRRFGVSQRAVWQLVQGLTWAQR